jgi:hypothetical protein
MKKSVAFSLILTFILAFVFSLPATLAAGQSQETESTVPELTAFHEVIYPIWHTAYPEKDCAGLRKFALEVKAGAEKIYTAKLPGILRERQVKWDLGVAELKKTVDAYLDAAAGQNDQDLLSAAEALHSRYEMLLRIIRPVLKEVDDFHKVLYVVYHQYLPGKDYEKIRGVAGELVTKAEAIGRAALPKRLKPKAEAFHKAAADLYESAKTLAATKPEAGLAAAVENVHSKYQDLEKVFE